MTIQNLVARPDRILAAAIAFTFACMGRNNIGEHRTDGSADDEVPIVDAAPGSMDLGLTPQPDGAVTGGQVGTVGPSQSWTGYVENFMFPSGSDVIKMVFAFDEAGNMVGSVSLGNGTPPPPPVDPDVGYPPGVDSALYTISSAYVAEGFHYSMHAGRMTGRRLQFGINLRELWKPWCEIQSPVDGSGLCLPNWGFMLTPPDSCSQTNPSTGENVAVDCGKVILCNMASMCMCTVSSCTLMETSLNTITFDLAVANDGADGSVIGALGSRSVHFTKDR